MQSTNPQPNPETGANPAEQPKPYERAELAFKLAGQAWDRFKDRREIEWKTTIGIWTLFGAAAATVLVSNTWQPTWFAFIAGIILGFSIVFIYRIIWQPYIAESHRRDQLTSYFWESVLQKVTGERFPEHLEPNYFTKNDLWQKAENATAVPQIPGKEPDGILFRLFNHATFFPISGDLQQRFRRLHPVGAGQFWVTLLLALTFLTVWCDRFVTSHCYSPAISPLQSFEIHSEGNLDLKAPAKPQDVK